MKIQIEKINLDSRISTHLAFVFLMVLGFSVAFFVVSTGDRIMNEMKESSIIRVDNRMLENK